MTSITETLRLDTPIVSECCGSPVEPETSTCTKCEKKCDWGIDLDD